MRENPQHIGQVVPIETTRMGRMLMAGGFTATMLSKRSGEHITLTFNARQKKTRTSKAQRVSHFNEATHVYVNLGQGGYGSPYIGVYMPNALDRTSGGKGMFFPGPRADKAQVYAAVEMLKAAHYGVQDTAAFKIEEAVRCGRCGRELTDPVSIERGIGPDCYGEMTGSVHYTKAAHPENSSPAEQTPVPVALDGEFGTLQASDEGARILAERFDAPADKKGRDLPRTFDELAAGMGRR